jgi:hypothetical protein
MTSPWGKLPASEGSKELADHSTQGYEAVVECKAILNAIPDRDGRAASATLVMQDIFMEWVTHVVPEPTEEGIYKVLVATGDWAQRFQHDVQRRLGISRPENLKFRVNEALAMSLALNEQPDMRASVATSVLATEVGNRIQQGDMTEKHARAETARCLALLEAAFETSLKAKYK